MRRRTSLVVLALATVLGSCGGGAADDDSDPEPTGSSATTDTPSATTPEASDTTIPAPTTTEQAAEATATGAGDASLTIGDMSYEFSGLTCYLDAAAAEAYGDEDATFAALAQDGDATLIITVRDKGIELFEVGYIRNDGSATWHMVSNDVEPNYLVEDGRITAEGEFELILDSEETDTTEVGSIEASCG